MKTTLLSFLLPAIFFSFLLAACKKHHSPKPDNPYDLPNATQTGANIFACRVNGQNWISEKGWRDLGGGLSDTSFGVHGTIDISSTSGEQFEIGIIGAFIQSNMVLRLDNTTNRFARYWGLNVDCFTPNGGYGTVTVKAFDGELILTKVDRNNRIVSGNFWFNIETGFCDTMKVTDGRFDIRY